MDRDAIADRDFRIADEHASGATYAELSSRYGISRQRCHQIDEAVRRSRERSADELYARVFAAARSVGTSHSSRAYNVILGRDMENWSPTWDDIASIYNVGIVTAAVIAVALDVEIPSDAMDELTLKGYMGHWDQKIHVDTEDES